jgi:hypothetical protein
MLIMAAVLGIGVAWGQWREEGKEVPDEPWRKSVGGFGAMLLLTDKPDAFFEACNKPPSPDYKPEISSPGDIRRGSKVVAVVVFTNCRGDEKGNCDAEVDFKLLRPDGSVYAEHKGAELWRGKPAPPDPFLQLGLANLGFEVEPDDPVGEYRLEAVVRDKIAKVEVLLVRRIKVLSAE